MGSWGIGFVSANGAPGTGELGPLLILRDVTAFCKIRMSLWVGQVEVWKLLIRRGVTAFCKIRMSLRSGTG
jgi:hypothetical protein